VFASKARTDTRRRRIGGEKPTQVAQNVQIIIVEPPECLRKEIICVCVDVALHQTHNALSPFQNSSLNSYYITPPAFSTNHMETKSLLFCAHGLKICRQKTNRFSIAALSCFSFHLLKCTREFFRSSVVFIGLLLTRDDWHRHI
jgi:hypothetical protein